MIISLQFGAFYVFIVRPPRGIGGSVGGVGGGGGGGGGNEYGGASQGIWWNLRDKLGCGGT